jgi:hypothetical protein
MGSFGPLKVTLTVARDNSATIFIEGPTLGDAFRGEQVAGAYLDWGDLLRELAAAPDTSRCAAASRGYTSARRGSCG